MSASEPFRLPDAPVETDMVAKYFRGLGDPIRLRILELLRAEGELTVGQLVERLGIAQPKVSNHLACLRGCGLVTTTAEGRRVRYEIADPRFATVLSELVDLALPPADGCVHDRRGRVSGHG